MPGREPLKGWFYEVGKCAGYLAAKACGHLRHYNRPRLGNVDSGVLVVSNHQSFWDPVLVGTGVDVQMCFLARESLFRPPGFGTMIRALHAHPVRRGRVDSRALKTVLRLLRDGRVLLMFPEGTRTRDGSLGRFRTGAAAIARRCGVPVLPACVEGAWASWPRTRTLPRPAAMAVAYGSLMEPRDETPEELTRRMRDRIEGLQKFLRAHMRQAAGAGPLGPQTESETETSFWAAEGRPPGV